MLNRENLPLPGDKPIAIRQSQLQSPAVRDAAAPNRQVFVVLGMHRSGTSLLANMLHNLGIDMADSTDHVSPKNAGGFWERPDLVAIHDEILEAIGRPIGSPSHVLAFPPAWWRRKEVQAIKPKLVDYVAAQLARSTNHWGFKDPRTCRLLPLWCEVFRDLHVEPVYIHALRSPSEAAVSMSQKTPARKISVPAGELMWLSYNLDIVRHVTLKQPSIIVEFQSWFEDGAGVAQRLAEALQIGRDLDPEEIADCVTSVVRADYRHQAEGDVGKPAATPLSDMFYTALCQSAVGAATDVREVRAQSRLIELFLKSIRPIIEDLQTAAGDIALVQSASGEAAEREAAAQQALAVEQETNSALRSDLAEAAAERARERANASELRAEYERATAKLLAERSRSAELRTEQERTQEQLVAERLRTAALESERDRLAATIASHQTVIADLQAASDRDTAIARQDQAKLAELASNREQVNAALATLEGQLQRATTDLATAQSERGRAEANLAKIQVEHEETGAAYGAMQAEHERTQTELATAAEEILGFRRKVAELESAGQTAAQDALTARDRIAELESAGETAAEEALRLRDTIAELESAGESGAREALALNDRISELEAVAETARKAADLAKQRNCSLIADLNARVDEIRDLRASLSVQPECSADSPATFSWPARDGAAPLVGEATVRCDEQGIQGSFHLDRSDVLPVVEARVGGELALAQACTAEPNGRSFSFHVRWGRFAAKFAGADAVLQLAGIEHELGRVSVPADLREYHLPAPIAAAKMFGGSVDEAAEYQRWVVEHETVADLELSQAYYAASQQDWPTITVLVHGGEAQALASTFVSLADQVYRNWEAVVVDGASLPESADHRLRACASQDLGLLVSELGDDALVTFVQAGDRISPTALLHLAEAVRQAPDFALIYSDEDRVDPRSGARAMPHMKGEWSPDLALVQDYVSRLALVRGRSVRASLDHLDSAEIYAIVLRAGLLPGARVVHLPFVLYHRGPSEPGQHDLATVVEAVIGSSGVSAAAARVVPGRDGEWSIDWPLPDPAPRVSLIVPTRDRLDLLKVSVDGFLHETDYPELEILIVDNDSGEEDTLAYLSAIADDPRVRVIHSPGPFNYSALNNLAAGHATGSVIGLMNNDLKVKDPDWLRVMVSHAVRPDVGIVGAKLLYGDDTIQHAGVTLGIGIASHLYKSFPVEAAGHHRRLALAQDVSAVTAACLLVRKEVWTQIGGLDEEFPVAYNDVDLCLRASAAGYRVLWTPDALLYHLESQSRGKDVSSDKRERLDADKARLLGRWTERLARDPFHSPNLSAQHVDGRLAFPPRIRAPWLPAAEGVA